MTSAEKLAQIKVMLGIAAEDTTIDDDLSVYLDMAGAEILNWMYINKPEKRAVVTEVPLRYEIVQVNAVVSGYSHKGAYGETVHNENGINRTFKYDDMVAYIRTHVFQVI